MDEILTLSEVAELTRLPLNTLRYYRSNGSGPRMFRLGRRVVARRSAVVDWIDEQDARGADRYQAANERSATSV